MSLLEGIRQRVKTWKLREELNEEFIHRACVWGELTDRPGYFRFDRPRGGFFYIHLYGSWARHSDKRTRDHPSIEGIRLISASEACSLCGILEFLSELTVWGSCDLCEPCFQLCYEEKIEFNIKSE